MYSGVAPQAWRRLLLLIVFLIAYASLYPWELRTPPANPVWMLLNSWPSRLDPSTALDGVLNFVVYLPLGAVAFFAVGRRIAAAVALALLLSGSIELLQAYDVSRDSSCYDVAMNVAGAYAGALIARTRWSLLAPLERWMGLPPLRGHSLLLLAWAGYQAFPFLPSPHLRWLAAKLEALAARPHLDAVSVACGVVDWLAVARLLQGDGGARRLRKALLLMMLLVPARLVIATRDVSWSQVAAAAGAWLCWSAWLWKAPRRTLLLAWLTAAVILVRQLAPFQFSATAHAFNWVPFSASLGNSQIYQMVVLLNKSFLYGTAAWLAHAAGLRWLSCAAALAGLLAATESLQRFLPRRTPEITDPLLALLLIVVLALLDLRTLRQTS